MATVYSLVCWGGLNGKTVTMTIASPCVVTSTNHGLKNGTGIVFTTTGALPTGVTSGTTYYAGNVATSTFNLYDTQANAVASGSTGRVNTSGSQSGTHTAKSAYRNSLSDLSRWGSTRIYDGLVSWNTGRAGASAFDTEVCEIGEAFTEIVSSDLTISVPSAATTITTYVNGTRSANGASWYGAYHSGTYGNGYKFQRTPNGSNPSISLSKYRTVLDGFTVTLSGAGYTNGGVGATAPQCGFRNMYIVGRFDGAGNGIQLNAALAFAVNNIVIGWGGGIYVNNYNSGMTIANNTSCKNTTGFTSNSTTNILGFYYNNISIGNTTNWGTAAGFEGATNNYGLSGDTKWVTTGGTSGTIATTDFTDYTNNDYRPAAITSPQVETAVEYYGATAYDIADSVRPSYTGSNYGLSISAGSFVTGLSYTVATKGTTDFTACGATSNSVTFTDSGDTVGWTGHPLSNGDTVYFSVITTTTGISVDTLYYVVNKAANTFQVASTLGGSALALTTNGTGTVVLTTFKATGAGTGTGTATLNAKYDVGACEYDQGYGLAPNLVTVAGSGMIDGSRLKIAKQSDGTELRNVALSGTTTDSYSQNAPTAIPVYIYVRKGTSSPYYKPVKISTTISATAGLTYDMTGLQVADIAARDYTATAPNISTDWSINTSTGVISKVSGSTVYEVRDLYSWHQDYMDDSSRVDLLPRMEGTTPTVFSLINSATISDADHQYLKGGSLEEASGATLWSNVYSAGTLTGSPTLYVVQNGAKVTNFWSSGHIDILVKVKASSALIDSGLITVYARKWGYTYDNYQVDMSSGGRNVAPVSTLADAAITDTTTTVSGWTDVTFTFGTLSRDFGDGQGSKTYYCEIDCNSRPLSEVYQRAQYVTREDSTTTLNSVEGWRYQAAHSSMTPVKSAPFGIYAGGFWSVAPGVYLKNVAASDLYSFVVTDSTGGTHQNTQSLYQSVTVSGLVVGSRVQIYDTTSSTELYNDIAAASSVSWQDGSAPVADRAIRVRIAYVSGTTAKEFIEASIGTCGQTDETKDVSYLANQSNDTTYNTNGVNGSTVTGITIVEGSTDRVQISIAGGSVSWAEIYAYQCYWNFTSTGIQDDGAFITAPDTANYTLTGFKIKNTHASTPLVITGGYGVDSTGSVSALYDTTGTSIFPAPAHVVPYATGSAVTAQDKEDIAAAVLTAAQSAPIYADMKKVAGSTVNGSGTAQDPWGP